MDISTTISTLNPLAMRVVSGILIFLFTLLAVKIADMVFGRLFNRSNTPLPTGTIFLNIIRVLVWLIGLSILLRTCFGIEAMSIVTALGVGGIAVSLGFQDTLSNLIGGLQISLGKFIQPDDYVETTGIAGKVKDITWRHTLILDIVGNEYLVPNALINKSSIVQLNPIREIDIDLFVPHDTDLESCSDAIVEHATLAVEQVASIAQAGVCMLWDSTVYGGIHGILRISIERTSCSDPIVVRDAALRGIEADLKLARQRAANSTEIK